MTGSETQASVLTGSSGPLLPLTRVMLRRLLPAYLVFAVLVVGMRLGFEYHKVRGEISESLHALATTFAPGAASAVWEFQEALLDSMAKGIGSHPMVVRVDIQAEVGNLRAHWQSSSEFAVSDRLKIDFPLYRQDKNGQRTFLGTLSIASSDVLLQKRLKETLIDALIGQLTLFIFFSLLLWLWIRYLVVQPLVRFSAEVEALSGHQHGHQIDLGKIEIAEIETMQNGFNALMQELAVSHGQIAAQNIVLEQKVRERTADLLHSKESLAEAQRIARMGNWELDLQNEQFYCSDETFRIFAIDREAAGVSYQTFLGRIHPADQELIRKMHGQSLLTRKPYGVTHRLLLPDGQVKHVHEQCEIIFDAAGKPLRLLGTVQDITERKRVEAELESYRSHLEELVETRTADLVEAKLAAESASRAKSAFLANMSHELRTPMSGVMGMIDIAKRRMLDPKGKEQLDKAKLSAEHLLVVLNDILDLSKIEAERMVLEEIPLRLGRSMAHVLSLLEYRARQKGLTLSVDLPASLANLALQGDHLRLDQVLVNLIGNAIKFTAQGSVTVRIREIGTAAGVSKLRFDISDTGIGIAEEALGRLFQFFEQADNSTTRKYGGTGLGLAISQRLVLLMGGEIGVNSRIGEGSTFWFVVPLKHQAEASLTFAPAVGILTAEQRLRAEFAGIRVLLAEDDPIAQEVSQMLLENVGCVVDLAADGRQALELARTCVYALILMDMQMPVIGGIEAARAIRADSLNREAPIVALTANAFREDRQACLAAGMKDHISKPVAPELLYETMLIWLERSATGLPTETRTAG